jgi:zinc D-Ala-D-Ala dipeptidase
MTVMCLSRSWRLNWSLCRIWRPTSPCAGAQAALRATLLAALASLGATSATAQTPPPGFSRLSQLAPDLAQDMRYAGGNNFTGAPVPGYKAPQCWLRADAARALLRAHRAAKAAGVALVLYDCYRPTRAVRAFADWSQNDDQTTKPAYFPNVEKRALFAEGYIAAQSTHSTGLAVDIGLKGKDFGAPFDFFDKASWTAAAVSPEARRNRNLLTRLMRRAGFENYPREWWHFTFKSGAKAQSFDAEIE